MDQWEPAIQNYPPSPDLRTFERVLQTAGVALREDLAQFEIEWITETLLYKPVSLLETITSKRTDESWSKPIGDAFKLLADVVTLHGDTVEQHYVDIVAACKLSYDPVTRKHALNCLTCIAKRSDVAASDATLHIVCLAEAAACKDPLARLVGTLCEHHPSVVADEMTTIWRVYLNLLDSNKNSDTVVSAVLRGILGLFRNFGPDLPTAELNSFYDALSSSHVRISKCANVVLSILEHHAGLFKERLSVDRALRDYLWAILGDAQGAAALRSVYQAIFTVVEKETIQKIISHEIAPRIVPSRLVKYTALRILTHAQRMYDVGSAVRHETDVHVLEFELRNGTVSYDIADAIAWSIESNLPNSDKLLQTAVLFYTNVPAAKIKEIVVHGVLDASPDARNASLTSLIVESCQDSGLDRYLPLWRHFFDSANGADVKVLEGSRLVFEGFMDYVVSTLEMFLDEDHERIPGKLLSLFTLTSHVLTLQCPEHYTIERCSAALALTVQCIKMCGASASVMAAARGLIQHLDTGGDTALLKEFYGTIDINRCRDEALLCETCMAIIQAPDYVGRGNKLIALQIIFSRNDVEPRMLSLALQKFEKLIAQGTDGLDQSCINEILRHIKRLRHRKDMVGKDARIMQRDITMFVGKYGFKSAVNNNTSDTAFIVKLKDLLTLSIPHPNEGTAYKINLQRILQAALVHEEPNALQILLIVICANLSSRSEPCVQYALTRVAHALCRAHAHAHAHARVDAAALQRALLMCATADCVRGIVSYISGERSPGVRSMLCDALEGVLALGPAGASADQLLTTVAEHAIVMMGSGDATTRTAGLDLIEPLTVALKENNSLSKELLPNILEHIAKTKEANSETAHKLAEETFLDKIELFSADALNSMVGRSIEILINHEFEMYIETDVKLYEKTVKITLDFIKNIYDYKTENHGNIVEFVLCAGSSKFWNKLYVMAEARRIFDFDRDLSRNLLSSNEFCTVNELFAEEDICHFLSLQESFPVEATLIFLEEYAEVLLELKYKKTLKYLANIISELTPDYIKIMYRSISSCLLMYKRVLKKFPKILIEHFEGWCADLPMQEITDDVDDILPVDLMSCAQALNMMLKIFDGNFDTQCLSLADEWPQYILHVRDEKKKILDKSAFVAISLRRMTLTDIKRIMLEGHGSKGMWNEDVGIQFCRLNISVFFDYFVKKPYVLVDDEVTPCCVLLNDVIKCYVRRKCPEELCDNVLDLVNELWPKYEAQTDFSQKKSLLLDLSLLPKKLDPTSAPMQWVMDRLNTGGIDEKITLIGVLPGGEAYSSSYKAFASHLPARLSELAGVSNAAFRALLDAAAATGDVTLLHVIATLAAADDTKGWWEEAIESCMASLAQKADENLYKAVYTRVWEGLHLGACNRLFVPLLRYSTWTFCERYLSNILEELLVKIGTRKRPSAHYDYHKYVVDCTRVLTVLQIVFEKMPQPSLESPNSVLYSSLNTQQSWYLVRQACKLCVTLRDKITCPDNADSDLRKSCRLFPCTAYNCLSAAICRMRPSARIYDSIFDERVWRTLTDCGEVYRLPLRMSWNQRTTRRAVSIDARSGASASSACTRRTRIFLRTLSENPLQYDLMTDDTQEPAETEDLQLTDNELNCHPCAVTLTALVSHACALDYARWLDTLAAALAGGSHRNVKWLLAQAICNSKGDLKPHANTLRPALFQLISDTADVLGDKKLLNGLHVDILDTLTHWDNEVSLADPTYMNSAIEILICTIVENRDRKFIFGTLMDCLNRIINLYGQMLTISWSNFEPYMQDATNDAAKACVQILQKIAKRKLHIPQLLPTLLSSLESGRAERTPRAAELLGLAMAAGRGRDVRNPAAKYHLLLDKIRKSNSLEYVRMVYYTQMGCDECCDEKNFRFITDQVPKLPAPERSKCLRIISTYVARASSTSDVIDDMFDTVDLCELILNDVTTEDALLVVKNGLHLMAEQLKRRLVMLTAGYCDHSLVKVRRAALEVMLKAYEELAPARREPPSKRQKTAVTSPILNVTGCNDVYAMTVVTALGRGVTRRDAAPAVREGVAERLADDMRVRFAECFLFTVYLPSTHKSTNKSLDLSVCVAALLDMLFKTLRSQDSFQKMKLRDEPLEMDGATPSGPLKLLTKSKTYQGTFRSSSATYERTIHKNQDANKHVIDVQTPIEIILDTLLKFAEVNTEASISLCVQVVTSLRVAEGRDFDFDSVMCRHLAGLLSGEPNELTPLVLEMSRVFIDGLCNVSGLQNSVEKLRCSTIGTEGEQITKLLHEEVMLRREGCEQFVLGLQEVNYEAAMPYDNQQFSLEDLVSAFGKLSNWDELTMQQKAHIDNSGLPLLWTDRDTFKSCLRNYTAAKGGWFDKLVLAYRGESKRDSIRWLREIDRWPRKHFVTSAVIEAIQWQCSDDQADYPCDIHLSDCLVEWSARLMTRSAHLSQSSEDVESSNALSRSHALLWCVSANERSLSSLALDCVKQNVVDLFDHEVLPWLLQKVTALRTMGLMRNDSEQLRMALETAEKFTPKFRNHSTPNVILGMHKLILKLNNDLGTVSKTKIDEIMRQVDTSNNKKSLNEIFELMMVYYDECWTKCEDVTEKQKILVNMTQVLNRVINKKINRRDAHVAMILNRLDDCTELGDDAAFSVLDVFDQTLPSLDQFSTRELSAHLHAFPRHTLAIFAHFTSRLNTDGQTSETYRKCFQLICDAEHTLLHYCEMLGEALRENDANEWQTIFDRMKGKIFENPHAGTDFQLLVKYKNILYEIHDYETTESSKKKQVLEQIAANLGSRRPQATLRLSQLCPKLASVDVEGDACLAKLLALPHGLTVAKFYEQISVFTDSVRRPCVIRALLSDGSIRRYLHKSGEQLRVDAAAQRAAGVLTRYVNAPFVGYNVTPLSDDCGLIEYLEGHERLRTLISNTHNLDNVAVSRPPDKELILAPTQASIQTHQQLCAKIPSYALRSAVERNSSCAQDFIVKKKRFLETLSSMTILNWVFGVGDRHLQNILYSINDGGVCCVDWAAIFKYGDCGELPPARLTRNLLAVCDVTALESRLQNMLSSLRENHKLYIPIIKISFKWMKQDFLDKVSYIEDILKGNALSCEISKDVIRKSTNKEKYVQLLDKVFEKYNKKTRYSVEEQISCLLQHCTDPRILGVTRSGWEPWV